MTDDQRVRLAIWRAADESDRALDRAAADLLARWRWVLHDLPAASDADLDVYEATRTTPWEREALAEERERRG